MQTVSRNHDHPYVLVNVVLCARKMHLVVALWVFGQHCNEWQIWNLLSTFIKVLHTGKLIYVDFLGSKIAPPPPKFCGPVRPNTSNMPKAGPA